MLLYFIICNRIFCEGNDYYRTILDVTCAGISKYTDVKYKVVYQVQTMFSIVQMIAKNECHDVR